MFRSSLFAGQFRPAFLISFPLSVRVVVFALLSLISMIIAPVIASAQNLPPLRVLMLPRLISGAIQQMLPIVFDSPNEGADVEPQKISVVALVYCGGDSVGGANAVGVAVPGQAHALSSTVLAASDCSAPLANIAARLMSSGAGPEWLEVIKLRAVWTPWRLTLAIADSAGAARPGFTAPNLSRVGQIKSYNTAGLRPLTGRGSNVS